MIRIIIPLTAVLILVGLMGFAGKSDAGSAVGRPVGQTVYVPVYSHIYSGDRERPIYLAATLSIRNTDPAVSILVTAVDYHDSKGRLLKKYVDAPIELSQMASMRYVVKKSDKEGGSGANFIVKWESKRGATPPLIESVMISTQSQLGISFVSRGKVISEKRGDGGKKISDIPPHERP